MPCKISCVPEISWLNALLLFLNKRKNRQLKTPIAARGRCGRVYMILKTAAWPAQCGQHKSKQCACVRRSHFFIEIHNPNDQTINFTSVMTRSKNQFVELLIFSEIKVHVTMGTEECAFQSCFHLIMRKWEYPELPMLNFSTFEETAA